MRFFQLEKKIVWDFSLLNKVVYFFEFYYPKEEYIFNFYSADNLFPKFLFWINYRVKYLKLLIISNGRAKWYFYLKWFLKFVKYSLYYRSKKKKVK